MGVDFQLQASYVTGKINGTLTGGRTTSGNPVECVSNEDPSIVYDTAFVDYIYEVSEGGRTRIDIDFGETRGATWKDAENKMRKKVELWIAERESHSEETRETYFQR